MSTAVVDEASVYGCTGHPTPKEMKTLLEWCLNEPISVAFQSEYFVAIFCSFSSRRSSFDTRFLSLCHRRHVEVLQMKLEKGIALQDIVSGLHPLVMRGKGSCRAKE